MHHTNKDSVHRVGVQKFLCLGSPLQKVKLPHLTSSQDIFPLIP